MGIINNGIIIKNLDCKFLQLKDGRNRKYVFIIECISAGGQILPPLVIFAGKHVQQQWFPDAEKERYTDCYFEASSKSWTNNDIALRWLKGMFISLTKPENLKKWRLCGCESQQPRLD
jgi:hypothetical protein